MEVSSSFDQATGSTYTSHHFEIGKTRWSVLVVSGKSNFITVRKIYPNPFGTLGKQFKTIDEAQTQYKNPDLKLALLKIETGII